MKWGKVALHKTNFLFHRLETAFMGCSLLTCTLVTIANNLEGMLIQRIKSSANFKKQILCNWMRVLTNFGYLFIPMRKLTI